MIDYEALTKHRAQTKKDILKLLETHDRVGCIRPTGYGKSIMISELYYELDGKCLIITPTNILVDRFLDLGCFNCITYSLLHSRINDDKFINQFSNVKYILLDEVHRLGNNKWMESLRIFLDKFKFKVIGFTATPVRPSDSENPIITLLNNVQVKPLYLEEAYNLHFIDKIKYVLSYYNIRDINRRLIEDSMKLDEFKMDNIFYINDIIKRHYNPEKNGTKIIVFCKSLSVLNECRSKFYDIFKDLYKDWNINTYAISYKDKDNSSLDRFKETKEKSIDLIFSINKLNEGVHINQVNTVIFMRPTTSAIIYLQQLGRSMNNKESLIFDFSNNLEENKVYFNRDSSNKRFKSINELINFSNFSFEHYLYLVDYVTPINEILIKLNLLHKQVELNYPLELSDDDIEYIKSNASISYLHELATYIMKSHDIPSKYHKNLKTLISKYCSNNNIKTKNGTVPMSIEQHILRLAPRNGKSEIAEKLGISTSTITNVLRKYNITCGELAYKRLSSYHIEKINNMYNLFSKQEICTFLKIPSIVFESFTKSKLFKPRVYKD